MAEVRPSLASAICYRDPRAALDWLERAFGFEVQMLLEDAQGDLMHSEMTFQGSLVMVGKEWTDDHRSPASIGGKNTQTVHIQLSEGIDAHCERARAAGAEILQQAETQFYGDRTYRCRDPEGHIWTVGQTVEFVSREEHEAAGVRILAWPA